MLGVEPLLKGRAMKTILNRLRGALGALLLVVFGAFTPASPAYAVCDGCVVGAVNLATAAITAANTAIVGAIVEMRLAIIDTIKGVGQVNTALQAQVTQAAADANVDAQASMGRAENNRNWQLPDECAVTASSHGVADTTSRAPGRCTGRNCASGAGGGGGLSSNQVQALSIAGGFTAAPAPEVQAALASSGACASFVGAGSSSARLGRCTVANLPTGASNGHPDADIRAETLFDGPQSNPSQMVKRLSVNGDATSSDYRAVQSLMKNLDTPLELRDLKRAELTTDSGRRYLALRDAYDARMAVAQKPAQALVANRLEDKALIDYVKQLLTSTVNGAWLQTRLAKTPNWQSRGISFDEMLDIEASRRHLNKDWHARMAELPAEGNVREQTAMLAFQVYLLAQMNQKLDYIAVAGGQSMAAAVRSELLPQLASAHQAATK